MSIVTKEGITVRVGQVWRDLDKRMGDHRLLTVVDIDTEAGRAVMRGSSGMRTKVAIKRMHRHGQGFALISEPSA